MFKNAYCVSLGTAPGEIPRELVDLAADMRVTPELTQLIYLDPFNAYKVAAATGGVVSHGNIQSATEGTEGVHFSSDHKFIGPISELSSAGQTRPAPR